MSQPGPETLTQRIRQLQAGYRRSRQRITALFDSGQAGTPDGQAALRAELVAQGSLDERLDAAAAELGALKGDDGAAGGAA